MSADRLVEHITINYQSSIRIDGERILYFDPYELAHEPHDADMIFITHEHSDHFSGQDILRVRNEDTIIVLPSVFAKKAKKLGFSSEHIVEVEPDQSYEVEGLIFETVSAYNLGKMFHIKRNGWVGYIVDMNGIRYYIAGDTDVTEEAKQVYCDVALVPIGGKFTMNAKQAAELVNIIKPKVAVPTHYGCIVGKKEDAEDFKWCLDDGIAFRELMKL